MARLHACRSLRYRDGVSLARVWLQEVPGGRGIRLGAQTPEESVERGAWSERESAPRLCSATRVNGRDGNGHALMLAAVSTIGRLEDSHR